MGSRPSVRRPGGSCGSRASRISAAGRIPEVEAAHVHVSASRGSRSGPSSRSPGPRAFPGRSSPSLARPVSCVSYLCGNLVLLLRTPRIQHGLDATTETGHHAGRSPTSTVDTHSSRPAGKCRSPCQLGVRLVGQTGGSRMRVQTRPIGAVARSFCFVCKCSLSVCLFDGLAGTFSSQGRVVSRENHSPQDSVERGDERSSGDCS